MSGTAPQVSLETVDYIVMTVYMAGLIGLGLYYRRLGSGSVARSVIQPR